MKLEPRMRYALAITAACGVAASAAAQPASTSSEPALSTSKGQAWPARPVRIIAPFPPGGGTDTVGRLLAQKTRELRALLLGMEEAASLRALMEKLRG